MNKWRSWSVLILGLGSAVIVGLAAVVILTGQGDPAPTVVPPSSPANALGKPPVPPAPNGAPGMGRAEAQVRCTANASDSVGMAQALGVARPGDRICLSGDMGATRLKMERSGTPDRPIVILGGGKTTTQGISIDADHIVVDGVIAQQPSAPGIALTGVNITVKNSASLSPRGGDGDGIRFWGTDLKIVHNTIRDTNGTTTNHADCMQTFATDEEHPASQNVLIDSNRCEDIDNICLIAEGPHSEAGDGSGEGRTRNIVFSNNYCQNGAGQAVFLDDVVDAQMINNEIVGDVEKAFSFQNGSTGAKVRGNKIGTKLEYEVGIDDASEAGYQGPTPGGGP